jgi:membrane-bound inhibitor of C-type lysozyme
MRIGGKLTSLTLALTGIVLITAQAGCAGTVQSQVNQYIPPSYYACTETTVDTLLQAYFSRYNAMPGAEIALNGQIFVFKNVVITASSLKYAGEDYIWVQQTIQCYFLDTGRVHQLKAGDTVDVVGVDAGICKEYSGTLVFKGCIFLPAGSAQLPAAGTPGLTLPSY